MSRNEFVDVRALLVVYETNPDQVAGWMSRQGFDPKRGAVLYVPPGLAPTRTDLGYIVPHPNISKPMLGWNVVGPLTPRV